MDGHKDEAAEADGRTTLRYCERNHSEDDHSSQTVKCMICGF